MKIVLILVLILSIAFSQAPLPQGDNACSGNTSGKFQQNINGNPKCLEIHAVYNVDKLLTAVEDSSSIVTKIVGQKVDIEFKLTEPNTCKNDNASGDGSEACFLAKFYSVSVKNKGDQDAVEVGGSLLSSKVLIDLTKAEDTTNWCNAKNGQGVIQCTFTASYGYTGVTDGTIVSKSLTFDLTINESNILNVVVDDYIEVVAKDKQIIDGNTDAAGIVPVAKKGYLTRHINNQYNEGDELVDVEEGDIVYLQLQLDDAEQQKIGPFDIQNYEVYLKKRNKYIDLTPKAINPTTVDIGSGSESNHVFRIEVPMEYAGNYGIKVIANQPTPAASGRRRLGQIQEESINDNSFVNQDFLSIKVLPKN